MRNSKIKNIVTKTAEIQGILNNKTKVDFVNYASSKLPEYKPELIEGIMDYLLKEHFKLH